MTFDTTNFHARPIVDTRGVPLNLNGTSPACAGCGANATCTRHRVVCTRCDATYPCCGTCCASVESFYAKHDEYHAREADK